MALEQYVADTCPAFHPAIRPTAPAADTPSADRAIRGARFVGPDGPRAEMELLADRIAELSARIQAATYELLVLIHQFDQREGWSGFASCAHWLSWRIGLAPGAAREKVRVARALADLPLLSDAMRRGVVSYSKVRAVTRVATPETEQTLLDVALAGTGGARGAGGTGLAAGRPDGRSGRRPAAARQPRSSHLGGRRRHGGHPGAAGAGSRRRGAAGARGRAGCGAARGSDA